MGYFLLHRRFFEHPLWTEKREFSKAEAWIDLIEQARWKDEETSLMHNGQIVKWGRGQLVASVRFLRDRWKWRSNNKVTRFLDLLEKENMIRYDKRTVIGRITICKYDTYQLKENEGEDTNGTRTGQAEDETGIKGNNGKEGKIPSLSEVKSFFKENGYSIESAERAYNYYQESINGTKKRIWRDGRGNEVRNWKQKMRSVWFKEENKLQQNTPPPGFPTK